MRAVSVLAALSCVFLVVSAADAGTHTYKFRGTMDDTDSTKFTGWFTFDGIPDDSYASIDSLGAYLDEGTAFIDWGVKVGSDSYEPTGTFTSDEVYVIDGDNDEILIYSTYSSVVVAIELKDTTGNALSGSDLTEPIHNLGWDKMTFTLYTDDGSQTGTIETISQPLPPAAWTGLGLLCGIGFLRRIRRRR